MLLNLSINREVSLAELKLVLQLVPFLKETDTFSLEAAKEDIQVATRQPPPVLPQLTPTGMVLPRPRIVADEPPAPATPKSRRYEHRRWRERLEDAFAVFEKYRNGQFADNVELLRDSFDWSKVNQNDWVPYTREELGEILVLEPLAAELFIRRFLVELKRCPKAGAVGYMLPPTMDKSAAKEQADATSRAAENSAATGDAHIERPYDVRKAMVVAFNKLDYSSCERYAMTYATLLQWLGVRNPTDRSTIVMAAKVLRKEYGYSPSLTVFENRERVYLFPPPRKGKETFPGVRKI